MRVVVLASGGLDSAVLIDHYAQKGDHVFPLFLRGGLRWEAAELESLLEFVSELELPNVTVPHVLKGPFGEIYGRGHWSVGGSEIPNATSSDEAVYLPGRNLLLLSYAGTFAGENGAGVVALGTLAGNPFDDATPEFFRAMGEVISGALRKSVRVEAPFRTWTKADVIRHGKTLPLHLTWSCLTPRTSRHCGRCNKCAERRKAFADSGVPDPTAYEA